MAEASPEADSDATSADNVTTIPAPAESESDREHRICNEMVELMKLADIKEGEGNAELAAQLRREACIKYRLWHGINNRGDDPICELAHCYDYIGNDAKAIQMQRNIVRLYSGRYGEVHINTLLAKNELAQMVFSHNDKRESETLYRELLDKTHRFLGSNHYECPPL